MGESRVKLLLDENLSRRLVPLLQDIFPGTSQVSLVGLERASDQVVWAYAKAHDFVILTKDDDFSDLLGFYGHPPKIVLLKLGNCSNQMISSALHDKHLAIHAELSNSSVGLVAVY